MKKPLLHELMLMELQDLYDAEQQIVQALPTMVESANNQELQDAFQKHLQQTEEHVTRLESVAEKLEADLEGESCEGMEGLLAEGEEIMQLEDVDPRVTDLALISAAQKVEHYEISGYGTVITLLEAMEHTEAAQILKKTIDEEKETDKELTTIAEKIMRQIKD